VQIVPDDKPIEPSGRTEEREQTAEDRMKQLR
jgi:hypothetical protein